MRDLGSSSKDSVKKHVHVFKWHYIGCERCKDVICLRLKCLGSGKNDVIYFLEAGFLKIFRPLIVVKIV